MSTYSDMQTRIADELARADLTTEIQQAIQTAIAYYQPLRLYGTEQRVQGAFNTVQSQEFYGQADWSEMPNVRRVDRITVTVATNRYTMNPRTPQYMEDVSVNPLWEGQPIDFSFYNQQLRFYPIPDAVYPVTVMGTMVVAAPVNGSDSNFWTNDAELLIRSRAKRELLAHVIRDTDMLQVLMAAEADALANLKRTSARMASTRIRPTGW